MGYNLLAYQYEVEFRSTTKHANADGLSQLPLEATAKEDTLTQAASLAKQKHLGCKKRRGQSEAAVI